MIYAVTNGTKTEWEIHNNNCQHIARRTVYAIHTIEADSPKAARTEWIDAEMVEQGWREADVRIMPCSSK